MANNLIEQQKNTGLNLCFLNSENYLFLAELNELVDLISQDLQR